MESSRACFTCDSVIRGYQIYKDIWEASSGQVFPCLRESGNAFNPFAVSVVRHGDIIDHVPKKIYAACSLFLRNSGSIECTITGSRQKYFSWVVEELMFLWIERNHEIHENLNPLELNTLTV